jgi:hypothetical protein
MAMVKKYRAEVASIDNPVRGIYTVIVPVTAA